MNIELIFGHKHIKRNFSITFSIKLVTLTPTLEIKRDAFNKVFEKSNKKSMHLSESRICSAAVRSTVRYNDTQRIVIIPIY